MVNRRKRKFWGILRNVIFPVHSVSYCIFSFSFFLSSLMAGEDITRWHVVKFTSGIWLWLFSHSSFHRAYIQSAFDRFGQEVIFPWNETWNVKNCSLESSNSILFYCILKHFDGFSCFLVLEANVKVIYNAVSHRPTHCSPCWARWEMRQSWSCRLLHTSYSSFALCLNWNVQPQ